MTALGAAPSPLASDLEQLAARHVPGSGPVKIDALGSGLVNSSYRVRRDGMLFSLRIAAPRAAQLGLDRDWECRVLRCASAAGIAPRVERCEPAAGVLVTRWVEGRCWTAAEATSPEKLEIVARLARRVHALPIPAEPRVLGPAQWIAFYRRSLAGGRGGESPSRRRGAHEAGGALERSAQTLLEALAQGPPPPALLCHSDLHVHNLVVTQVAEPVLLDWEYAHVSEALWDLAGWSSNADLGTERRQLLLESYLGREPAAAEAMRLEWLVWLYDYVCLLWSEIYLSPARAGAAEPGVPEVGAVDALADGVAIRAGRLTERLQRALGACRT